MQISKYLTCDWNCVDLRKECNVGPIALQTLCVLCQAGFTPQWLTALHPSFPVYPLSPPDVLMAYCIHYTNLEIALLSWQALAQLEVGEYAVLAFGSVVILLTVEAIVVHIYIYGCGSKCKVWIKPRSHKRSRPLIQTPDPDLSKGVDPDLWSRPLEWYYLWASWCLQLFTLPSSQATNCFKATVPSCQTSKLHLLQSHAAKQSSCQAAKLHVLLSHAFKLSNCNFSQATKLSSCQADTVARPGCQAAKVSTCCLHLVVLFLSHCIQAAIYTKKWVQF